MIKNRIVGIILVYALVVAMPAVLLPVVSVSADEVKMVFNAKEDGSDTQGKNNWYYKYAPLGAFAVSNYSEFATFTAGNNDWWHLYNDFKYGRIRTNTGEVSQSSGNEGDSARVFVAPYSGKVTLSMEGNSMNVSASNDVLRFRIYKNDDIIYPAANNPKQELNWLVLVAGNTESFSAITLDVTSGDNIIFRVNKGSNANYSGTDSDGKVGTSDGDRLWYNPIIKYLSFTDDTEEPNDEVLVSHPRYYMNGNTEIYTLTDGSVRACIDITNLGDNAVPITLYAVLYDGAGKEIKKVSRKDIGDISGGEMESTYIDIDVEDCSESLLKIFVWKDLKPLNKPFELKYGEFKALTLYTTIPEAIESTAYSVTVNGQKVFVEKFKDISYARFAFAGSASVTVSVNENISTSNISPHSYKINPEINGKSMTFGLEQSRKLIININNLEKLFIFADPLEENPPNLGDEGVYNILDYTGIDRIGVTLNTQQIQNALDNVASKPGGGVLYFPNGKYLTGKLHIKSNTTVYLQDGALIQGTTNAEDYPKPLKTQDGTEALISALLCFDQANNSKLTGRGVVSGGGSALRAKLEDVWLVSVMESTNIVVEDVILRDPSAFNSHICFSEYVTYQRVKIINDINLPNTDGIDPDSSRHIVIDDVFSYCSDDSVSIKTHRFTTLVQDSFDIEVKNCVFWTRKSALKIGDETLAYNMYNFRFINNDIVRADRAIVAYISDGSTVSNVYWINNRAEEIGGDTFERLIDFWIRIRSESSYTPGKIENFVIKDFYAEKFSKNNSNMEGFDAEHQIKNIYIDNFVVAGQKVNTLSEAKINMNQYVQNVIFAPAPELPLPSTAPFVSGTFVERNGMVVFEAEHYNSIQSKDGFGWVLDNQKRGTLGDGSMTANSTSGASFTTDLINKSPQMNYKVNFSTTGTYYVWARMYAPRGVSDRLYIGVDGNAPTSTGYVRGNDNKYGWYWSNIYQNDGYTTIEITEPGEHIVNVYMGGKTLYFDKMFLWKTNSGANVPKQMTPSYKGMGPMESETVQ